MDPYTLDQAEEEIADLRGQVDLLSEIIKLNLGVVPNNPASGEVEIYGDSASGLAGQVLASGANGTIPFVHIVSQPLNTVTAASLTNLFTWTINANDAQVMAVYESQVWGNGTQASGSRQTLQFAAVLGGNTMSNVTFGTTAFEAVSQAFRFNVIARAICLTTGSTGTWTSYIDATVADFNGLAIAPGNNDFATAFSCELTGTTTVDTTTGNNFGVSAAWGATTGSPTLTSRIGIGGRIA